MEKLSTKRRKIDVIDEKIVSLIAKRMQISCEIGKLKKDQGLKIRNSGRERLIMKKIAGLSEKFDLPTALTRKVFALLIEESRKCQKSALL